LKNSISPFDSFSLENLQEKKQNSKILEQFFHDWTKKRRRILIGIFQNVKKNEKKFSENFSNFKKQNKKTERKKKKFQQIRFFYFPERF